MPSNLKSNKKQATLLFLFYLFLSQRNKIKYKKIKQIYHHVWIKNWSWCWSTSKSISCFVLSCFVVSCRECILLSLLSSLSSSIGIRYAVCIVHFVLSSACRLYLFDDDNDDDNTILRHPVFVLWNKYIAVVLTLIQSVVFVMYSIFHLCPNYITARVEKISRIYYWSGSWSRW